jgi:methionine synthase / methylenetetrahydrofolate reductase(NADPH)
MRGPLLADGAIGTLLHERGVAWGRSLEQANLDDRQVVSEAHVDYLLAGAELITTNTFSANAIRLAGSELAERVRDVNLQGAKIAREAREVTGRSAFVAGSIGAIGRSNPDRARDAGAVRAVRAAYEEQVLALLEGGVDIVLLETFTDLEELRLAIEVCRGACDLPLVANMSFENDPGAERERLYGHIFEGIGEVVDVFGVNCSVGPDGALAILEQLRPLTELPLAVMPNAGLPSRRGGDFVYMSTPAYFGEYARRFVDGGASIVGGCCGTTPAHVFAMAEQLGDEVPQAASIRPPQRPSVAAVRPHRDGDTGRALHAPTRLAAALDRGEFVVSVEMAPPKGVNPAKVLEGARMLERRGLEFVNVTDSAMARVRMSCLSVALLIQQHTSLETIIHYTTRDRNLMALQSELVGAHALGVRNVLALTGDPPGVGDFPDATGVWDIDSIGLVEAAAAMNRGTDIRGRELGEPAAFCAGCAVNPTAEDLDHELERFQQKLAAGARFVMSQPLYDVDTLRDFLARTGPIPVPFLLGVLPVQSSRHAEFMHNEVPGISIPAHVREAMRTAGADGIATGIRLAQEFLAEVQEHVDGVYLMPSFGRYETCAEVLDALEDGRRPGTAGTAVAEPAVVSP